MRQIVSDQGGPDPQTPGRQERSTAGPVADCRQPAGRAPIANLAEQLAGGNIVDLPAGEVERLLRSGSYGLLETVKAANLPAGRRVLIVVDQFEELFRFSKETERDDPSRWDEAALFVKLLLAVADPARQAQPGATPVYVVLTMRSEYLGDCALFF